MSNRLIKEKSPYLLQHACNPVNWYAWGKEALQQAKTENKPIIVSIGYSACHWCHVMRRESFENQKIAQLMNAYFVCIKVDREERPDIDQVYMEAIQIMGIQGGWPLNIFLMPDAKPFYGGTYFHPKQWKNMLWQINRAFQKSYAEIAESSENFAREIATSKLQYYGLNNDVPRVDFSTLKTMYKNLSAQFDTQHGGIGNAPKFPLPVIYTFLLRYYTLTKNREALDHTILTLNRISVGGIYDQIGGGFARYSVDEYWFVPHFEKMLYDNGQLISLYAEAYQITKIPYYRQIIEGSVTCLKEEFLNPQGSFYAALDADSEGMEGKFYVWKADEIKDLLKEDTSIFNDFYHVKQQGNWENGYNILFARPIDESLSEKYKIDQEQLKTQLQAYKKILKTERQKRVKPALDNKILAAWNGIVLKGLANIYAALGKPEYLELAKKNAYFLSENMTHPNGRLFRNYHKNQANLRAYLEDYANVIQGYISLYEVCFEEKWLKEAGKLIDYAMKNLYDARENMFFFTDSTAPALIARTKELFDQAIPSSNSVMATNLYRFGTMMNKDSYIKVAQQMLGRIEKILPKAIKDLANWACLYTYLLEESLTIIIIGKDYQQYALNINAYFIPNKIIMASATANDLPLLKGKQAIDGKTTVYVCRNRTCLLPVHTVEEAIDQVFNKNYSH